MSYTTILGLIPENNTPDALTEIKELHNSHGCAPVIWRAMCETYLGTSTWSMFDGTMERLWPLYQDRSIPEYQRAVLTMTYDRAYIIKDDYARAANDIRKWLTDFPPIPNHVNHWDELATLFESEPDYPAIGLHCTSVSENQFEGEWVEETEEYLPVAWDTTFNIYDELDNQIK